MRLQPRVRAAGEWERRLPEVVADLAKSGVSIQPFDLVPGLDSAQLWDGVSALPTKTPRPPSQHVRVRPQFGPWASDLNWELGPDVAVTTCQVAEALAGRLQLLAERLAEMALIPGDLVADASWSCSLTRWGPKGERRLPMHVDWELLSFVVSPDGGLEFADGSGPSGPAAVLVAGDLLHRFSGSKILPGEHAVGPGLQRRSLMTFYLGNPAVCWGHGRLGCECSPTLRAKLGQRYGV